MNTKNQALAVWVQDVAELTRPKDIVWRYGSEQEYNRMVKLMTVEGTLSPLNPKTHSNCHVHLSDPQDVARVEHPTFICSENKQDAGDNNNCMEPSMAKAKMQGLCEGCMEGRTMYVIQYCMSPIDSPFSRCGVEITDSPYVGINMKLMTRMGQASLERVEREGSFVKGLHSTGELDPNRRFIMHFPEELSIRSYG